MSSSSSLLQDTFPHLAHDSHFLPKATSQCLPLLHRLPLSKVPSVELLTEKSFPNTGKVLMMPFGAKGRVIMSESITERKWIQQKGRHVVRVGTTVKKTCEKVNHPYELICGNRSIRECPRFLVDQHFDPQYIVQQQFLDEGNLILIQSKRHNAYVRRISIFRPEALSPEIMDTIFTEPFMHHTMALCSVTKCLWMIKKCPQTRNLRLFKSNSIFEEKMTIVEKKTMPFRNRKTSNPHFSFKKTDFWGMTIDDGVLYVYCGDRKLFYLKTLHSDIQRVNSSSTGDVEEEEIFTWHNVKLLHGTHLLTHTYLLNCSISAHRGKVYMCGGDISNHKKVYVGPNTNIYVWDLHRCTLDTVNVIMPKKLAQKDIAINQNSLFIVGANDDEKKAVRGQYVMEILLRETMPYSRAVGSSFSDVDVYCEEGPSCERIPLGRVTDEAFTVHHVEIRNDNSVVAHPVEEDAMRFMKNYAEKHGHAMPQVVGDGYAHLSGNVDPRLRYTSTSYSYSSMDTTTEDASAINAKPTTKKPQTKSRKRSKMTQGEYLQEVKDAEYDLISPMVGDDLMVIFEALDDPDVEFL